MTAKGLKRVKKRYLCHSTQNPVQHFQIAQNTEKLYLVWEFPSLTALVRLNPLVYLKQELSEADMHKIKTWWLKNLSLTQCATSYLKWLWFMIMKWFLMWWLCSEWKYCREYVGGNAGDEFLLPDMFDSCKYVLGVFYKYINK